MPPQIFDIFSRKKNIINKEKPSEKIIIDHREQNSLVISYLIKKGFEIEMKQIPVGDYIVKGVVIERKTVSDFISSMINKRLIKQLEELQQYPKKILIIEGIKEEELYSDSEKGINANAIRGFLLSIVLKWKVPIIFTNNSEDTANFISVIANKKEKSDLPLNVSKRNLSQKERMQFILEGFEGIGPKTAKKLLEKHKTLRKLFSLSGEELEKEIGKKSEGFKILEEDY